MLQAFRHTPAPVTFLILSFLLPTELSLYLGDLRLPGHRVALLLVFPFAVYRMLARRDTHIKAFDIGIAAFGTWMLAVYYWHSANLSGLVYGGSLALETTGAYLVARAWIRDLPTFQNTLKVIFIAIVVAALFALPETFLGRNFTHEFLAKVTGYVHPISVRSRLGLTRAYGVFDHPIHYGTFCAALFTLFWYVNRDISRRLKMALFISSAAFLSLSSAPLLCIIIQCALIAWERVTRGVPGRAWLTIAACFIAYGLAAMVATRSPIAVLATGITLDSQTGFYRLLIWEFGLQTVWNNVWFGIGLADWERPWWMISNTVDSFWLVTAMRTGLPSVLLLMTTIFMLVMAVVYRVHRLRDAMAQKLSLAWVISLIALCFIAATVHFWNVTHAFFFFFLGLGGWMADPRVRRAAKRSHASHRRDAAAAATAPDAVYGATPTAGATDWIVPQNGRVAF
jgi:hypothetical protein